MNKNINIYFLALVYLRALNICNTNKKEKKLGKNDFVVLGGLFTINYQGNNNNNII